MILDKTKFTFSSYGASTYAKKYLIEKYLKKRPDVLKNEMHAASIVLDRYPNADFWATFDPGFKLNSLYYFVGADGNKIVKEKYLEFSLDILPPKVYILDEKYQPPPAPSPKREIKTFKEFLQTDFKLSDK